LGALVGAVVLSALCAIQLWRIREVEKEIAVELDAIRAAGYPATLEELDEWYAYPDGPNAADVYAKAFAKFTKDDEKRQGVPLIDGITELPPPGEPLPEEMTKAIAVFLTDNAEATDLLHEAAKIKGCRFPVRFADGPDALMPYLFQLRVAAKRLKLAAVMAAEEGRADAATEHLAASIGLVRSLRNEPGIISQLVRMSCIESTQSALEQTMARVQLRPAQRAELAALFKAEERTETLVRAAAGERCNIDGSYLAGGPLYRELTEKVPFLGELWLRLSGGAVESRLFCLRWLTRGVGVARLPLNQRFEASRRVSAELEAACTGKSSGDTFIGQVMLGMLAPAYDRLVCQDMSCFARLRAARTALAVEGFREAEGRLPQSLDELVPKHLDTVPLDPFDGKPLRFKKREKGYVVYSIGEDGVDNGGAPVEEAEGADVPFAVAR